MRGRSMGEYGIRLVLDMATCLSKRASGLWLRSKTARTSGNDSVSAASGASDDRLKTVSIVAKLERASDVVWLPRPS